MSSYSWASLSTIALPKGLIGGPFGSNLGGRDYVSAGVPVIRGQNLSSGKFVDLDNCVHVSDAKVGADLARNLAVPGDLVFTQRGTLGQLAVMGQAHERAVISQSQMRLRVDPAVAYPEYVYYACSSAEFNESILTNAIVTGVPHINLGILGNLEIPLPPLDEQRRIAGVLGTLDDLVDTNNCLAQDSERLAQAIAQSAGSSVTLWSLGSQAAARPVVPAGKVGHYSLPAYDDGRSPQVIDGAEIKSSKNRILHPAVLISRLNPHIPRVWMVYPAAERLEVASTEFVPIEAGAASVEEIYAVTSSGDYLSQMASHVTGTTGSHQRVDKSALLGLSVPNTLALSESERESIRSLVQDAAASRTEAQQLRRIRDELLPLLMSGKVRVRPDKSAEREQVPA